MRLAIGIKTLNEAGSIAAAIESALAEAVPLGGRVVVADSGSADATVAIASRYPVDVIALADPAMRCCGAGAQLAWQGAEGATFFALMDGDMTLAPGFVASAIARMEADPRLAGVGGHVIERALLNQEFRIRAAEMAREPHRRPGPVDRLDGGGVYRAAAVAETGYFADRNLQSFEEYDLAVRLRQRGWRLERIDLPGAYHTGHGGGGYRLLWRRLRGGRFDGTGQVLRAAIAGGRAPVVMRELRPLAWSAVVWAWWLALAAALALAPMALPALFALPFALLALRRGAPSLALYSMATWNAMALGTLRGLLRGRTPPARPIPSIAHSCKAPRA